MNLNKHLKRIQNLSNYLLRDDWQNTFSFSFNNNRKHLFARKQWYAESIKSKVEIRQEILDEIKKDGQSIYKDEDYLQLQHNTELMNKWMNKNPKDAEKF